MKIIERAMMLLDKPYIWGGDGTASKFYGYDCSGLVLDCLWTAGIYKGSDTTAEGIRQWAQKNGTKVDKGTEESGTLIFFGTSSKATHVAIALGNGLMIEAGGGTSKCVSLETSTGSVRIRPIGMRSDYLESWLV